jgi:hypothetical protein
MLLHMHYIFLLIDFFLFFKDINRIIFFML